MSQSDALNCRPDAVKRHRSCQRGSEHLDGTALVGATQKWSHVQSWMLPDGGLESSGSRALWSSEEGPGPQALTIVRRVPEPCPELGGGPGGVDREEGQGQARRRSSGGDGARVASEVGGVPAWAMSGKPEVSRKRSSWLCRASLRNQKRWRHKCC